MCAGDLPEWGRATVLSQRGRLPGFGGDAGRGGRRRALTGGRDLGEGRITPRPPNSVAREGVGALVLTDILPSVARLHPRRPAFLAGDAEVTYAQLLDRVDRLAAAFTALGIGPGERVALLGWPCPALAEAELAAVAVGAIPCAAFPSLAAMEIAAIVLDADPTLLVFAPDAAAVAARITAPSLRVRLCTEPGGDHPDIERLIARNSPLPSRHRPDADDPALLIYTGGTTGRSRGVLHSHRALGSWMMMRPLAGVGGGSEGERGVLPNLAHNVGQCSLWITLVAGTALVFPPAGPVTAAGLADLVERYRLTSLSLTGRLLHDFVYLPGIERRELRSLRHVVHGAAATTAEVLRRAAEILAPALVIEGYGQTESGLLVTALAITGDLVRDHAERLLSCGSLPTVAAFGQKPGELRILDADGRDLPAGATGEVVFRGETLMTGYWRNPEATAAVLQDGWLRTGDLGRLDADGYLYLVDRVKDMVVVGSLNVYSIEVETALDAHPHVAESAVIGTPSRTGEGEEATAVVVRVQGCTFTLEDMRRFLDGRISEFKIPTRLEFSEGLPRTPVGKIDKVALREPFWAGKPRRIGA